MLTQILFVGAGGFLGAATRFLLTLLIKAKVSHPFPFATLAINLLGCFAAGLLVEYLGSKNGISENLILFLMVGVLGGFTTFSAFGVETIRLFLTHEVRLGLYYVAASFGLCLGGTFLGVWLGLFFKR